MTPWHYKCAQGIDTFKTGAVGGFRNLQLKMMAADAPMTPKNPAYTGESSLLMAIALMGLEVGRLEMKR